MFKKYVLVSVWAEGTSYPSYQIWSIPKNFRIIGDPEEKIGLDGKERWPKHLLKKDRDSIEKWI